MVKNPGTILTDLIQQYDPHGPYTAVRSSRTLYSSTILADLIQQLSEFFPQISKMDFYSFRPYWTRWNSSFYNMCDF